MGEGLRQMDRDMREMAIIALFYAGERLLLDPLARRLGRG